MTQNEQILEYLRNGRRLTPKEALEKFGSMRLAARIFELRKDGWPILEEIVRVPIRDGQFAQVARYYMSLKGGAELFAVPKKKEAFRWE